MDDGEEKEEGRSEELKSEVKKKVRSRERRSWGSLDSACLGLASFGGELSLMSAIPGDWLVHMISGDLILGLTWNSLGIHHSFFFLPLFSSPLSNSSSFSTKNTRVYCCFLETSAQKFPRDLSHNGSHPHQTITRSTARRNKRYLFD